MPKHRNPPHNFTVKGDSIYLTGAKKKLSPQEEEQLRILLTQRYWKNFLRNLGKAFESLSLSKPQPQGQ